MSEAQPPPLAAVIEGHSRYCDTPPKPSSMPFVGWGCSRVAPFPRAALILLGIFSLPDRAEECLRPPQGAGESSWPSTERAPGAPGAAALPWEARQEPGALSSSGRRRNSPQPAAHTCAGRDAGGFLQLALPFCIAGHKGAGSQPSPAATLALPCPPMPALAGGNTKPTSLQSW